MLDNQNLKPEDQELKDHPLLGTIRAVEYLAKITRSRIMGYSCRYDLERKEDKLRLEVKYSNWHAPTPYAATRRWSWYNLLGLPENRREYDALILVGEIDRRFRYYKDDESPYVLFLVPNTKVPYIVTAPNCKGGMCTLTTKFETVWKKNNKSQFLINDCLVHPRSINRRLSELRRIDNG